MNTRRHQLLLQVILLLVVGNPLFGDVALFASDSIRGPVLGYVFDRSLNGLRRIWGVPGASRMGEVWPAGVELSMAQLSSGQDFALGITKTEGRMVLVDLRAEPSRVWTIPQTSSKIDQVVFSSRGDSAILVSSENRRLYLIRGLPDSPSGISEVNLSQLPAAPQTFALSDDGQLLLMAVQGGEVSTLYSYSGASGIRMVGLAGQVSAMRFLNQSRDAVAVDRQAREVFLIRDLLGSAERILLASEREGITSPVALELSKDNQRVYVANAEPGGVVTINFTGGAQLTPCDCIPTALERMGDSIFRLTELSDKPLMLLDGTGQESRVLFVPMDNKRTAGGSLRPLPKRPTTRSIRIPQRGGR
jgi:hypothetical protein